MQRIVLILVLMLLASPALAERRVALVIGFDRYATARPLKNPVADAGAMKKALEALDFEVTLETDRDLRRTRRALEDFRADAAGADVALVYFAGHGAEIDGDNRLLPTDADVSSLAAFKASTLPLEDVRATVAAVGKVGLIILDACRNDPFGTSAGDGRSAVAIAPDLQQSVRPGLGRVGRAENVLFAFSAAPGETAADGKGEHSPFSAALARYLGTDGLEIRSVLTLVQQEVYDRSGGRQLPYVESGLPQLFFAANSGQQLPERERLLLAMADVTPEMRGEVETVASDAAMPLAPLYGALIGSDIADLSRGDRIAKLQEAAAAFVKVRDDLKTLASDDPEVTRLRGQAEQQLNLGELDQARLTLGSAADLDDRSRRALKVNFVNRTLSQVTTVTIRAGSALSGLKYRLAAQDYRTAATLYEEIPASDMTADLIGDAIRVNRLLGETLSTAGDLTEAAGAYRTMTAWADKRADAAPEDLDFRRDRSAARVRLALTLKTLGKVQDALASYERSLEIIQPLAASQPNNVEWQTDLGVSLSGVALARLDLGDSKRALKLLNAAMPISKRLMKLEPDEPRHRRNLFVTILNLGDLDNAQNNMKGALKAYRNALDVLAEAARQAEPGAYDEEFATAYARIGGVQIQLGRGKEAAAAFEKGAEIAGKRLATDPENDTFAQAYAASIAQAGEALLLAGDVERSISAYQRALDLAAQYGATRPGGWRILLGLANSGLGDAHAADDNRAAASEAYGKALQAMTARLDADPENTDAKLHLVLLYKKLAENGDEPRRHFQAALDMLLAMKKAGTLAPAFDEWIDGARQSLASVQ